MRNAGTGRSGLVRDRWLPLLAVVSLLPATPAVASAGDAAPERRWGLGWDSGFADSGIALRRYFSPSSGLAVRLNPNLSRADVSDLRSDEFRDSDANSENDDSTYALEIALFKEHAWGDWFRGGPMAALGYEYVEGNDRSHAVDDRSSETVITDSRDSYLRRTWSALIGLRPVFRFHDRLLLETQFGLRLRLSTTRSDDWDRREEIPGEGGDPVVEYGAARTEETSLDLQLFGEELGPASQLTFVVLF